MSGPAGPSGLGVSPPDPHRSSLRLALVLAIILVVIGGLVALAFGLTRDSEDEIEATTRTDDGSVFLEPAVSRGADPFTADLGSAVALTSARINTPGTERDVATALAGTPGLYGGTRNDGRCDKAAMLAFLQQHSDLARAWVGALNEDPSLRWSGGPSVSAAELPEYFAELTPVTLRSDTRVTNHGYDASRATPRDAVLEAGTAVLVDAAGVPRARCSCGNPLTRPEPVGDTPVYLGERWPGFDVSELVVVRGEPSAIAVFVLVELETEQPLYRPAGTTGDADSATDPRTPPSSTSTTSPVPLLGTGDVQVTLRWSGDADLDLEVTGPDGVTISYSSPSSPSGGRLDVDEIPDCGDPAGQIENVFWPTGGAPPGTYGAKVVNRASCPGPAASFELEVRVDGEVVVTDQGVLDGGETSTTVPFTVASDGPGAGSSSTAPRADGASAGRRAGRPAPDHRARRDR